MPRCHVVLADHGQLTLLVDTPGSGAQIVLRSALAAAARTSPAPALPIILDNPDGNSGYVRGVDERGVEAAERVLRAAGWDVERE